jgi:hypothetical protein
MGKGRSARNALETETRVSGGGGKSCYVDFYFLSVVNRIVIE